MFEKRVGFIGYGNMAQAIVQGWLKKKVLSHHQICACAAHYDKLLTNAAKTGIQPMKTAAEVVDASDFILLAVKPYQLESVIEPIKEALRSKVVLSIAAGKPFDWFEQHLAPGTHHLSMIPNTPISVAEGILITESRHSLSSSEFAEWNTLFEPVAMIEIVEPEHLSIAGTLSGCTPAYAAMFLEALADAGVKHGLNRTSAYRLACKMLSGTGKLALESGQHPGQLKDAVCSPGGTTIRGVATLEKRGFRGTVIEAIDEVETVSSH